MSQLLAFVKLAANLFRKPVTVDEAYGFLADTYRGMPVRDDEKCTGCGACFERCSSGATRISDVDGDRTVIVDGFNCIFCGRCADVCPEKALSLSSEGKPAPKDEQELLSRIDLSRYGDETSPTTETTLKLQRCSVCGEVMPVTEKFLHVVHDRALANLQPETAEVVGKDMEKYLTTCISCRQKYSLVWGTHPRKWI